MEHIVKAEKHYFPPFKQVLTAVESPAFVTGG